MKLKYYLRGLGTGIAVTALILGISSGLSKDRPMTDEEVLARAKQLGWSESTVLSEMSKETGEDVPQENQNTINTEAEDITEAEGITEAEDITEAEAVTETEEITETEDVTDSEDTLDNEMEFFGMPDEAGTVTITIVRGDSSDSVSRMLEEAGLVDSASAYDKYLCQNGYDKSIRIGNFEIPADATGEEIAKLITGR